MRPVAQVLAEARQHYQAGNLEEARVLYRQVLQQQPQQVESMHVLGMLAYREGNLEEATSYYQEVLVFQPENADAHNNLGILLKKLGQLEESIYHYQQALELKPHTAEFHHNLGKAWVQQDEMEMAIAHFQQAIALKPEYSKAYLSLSDVLLQGEDRQQAMPYLRQAILLQPKSYKLHHDLGLLLKEKGEIEAAVDYLQQAVNLKSDSAELRNNLGTALVQQNELQLAEVQFMEAIALKPDLVAAYINLGNVLTQMGAAEGAIKCLQQALTLHPDSADCYNQLGIAYKAQDKLSEAIAAYHKGLAINSEHGDLNNNLGTALREEGKWSESTHHYQEALAINPNDGEAHSNLAFNQLILGDLRGGFEEYEWRWQTSRMQPRDFTQPMWDGLPCKESTLLLHCEQGFGDSIQFIRYAPVVAGLGATIILECPQALQQLFRSVEGISQIVVQGEPLPAFDLHAPLMSLPHLLATNLETIPLQIPYLGVNKSSQPLPNNSSLKVGLAWAENSLHPNDSKRSCPLKQLQQLLEISDITFYSLQQGIKPQLPPIVDLSEQMVDFAATAAIIEQLDLVISVDTAVAHLAGAMGKPVWLLLSHIPDWRWLLEREDSPWYPTMHLFRQQQPGDWQGVVGRIAQGLQQLLNTKLAAQQPAPDNPEILTALESAITCYQKNQHQQAQQICQQILQVAPQQVDAINLLGIIAYQQGDRTAAAKYYQQVIQLQPDNPDAHNNLAILLKNQGQLQRSVFHYTQALKLNPESPEFHHNLGVVLKEVGEIEAAKFHCQQAITLKPNYAKAYMSLGNILLEQGEIKNAVAYLKKAIALNPKSAENFNQLAMAYKQQQKLTTAIKSYRQALQLKPNSAKIHNNLGNALISEDKWSDALYHLQQAIALKPDYGIAYHNLGKLLIELGKFPQASQCFQQAIALNRDHAEAHFGLAFTQLITGNLQTGFTNYEWRKGLPEFQIAAFPQPLWDGSPLGGKTIFLQGEQGLGDAIQFIRYASLVECLGGKIIVGTHPSLIRLFSTMPCIEKLVCAGDTLPDFDVHAPLLSLPHIFGTTLETIPTEIPYLHKLKSTDDAFPLLASSLLRVGIVWAGNPANERDRHRSYQLKHFLPLFQIPDITFYSLQKEQRVAKFLPTKDLPLVDLGEQLDDFATTAAVMEQLDLVITVDTAVAHLAGAMGKPTWILLANVPDWRWLLDRNTSPWYPTARLFRQSKPGDWEAVMASVAQALDFLRKSSNK